MENSYEKCGNNVRPPETLDNPSNDIAPQCDSSARPLPIEWEQRQTLGRVTAWWRTTLELTLHYRRGADRVSASAGVGSPATFLGTTLLLALLCDLIGIVPFVELQRDAEEPIGYALMLGIVALQWIALAVALPTWLLLSRLVLGFTGGVQRGWTGIFRAIAYGSPPLLARSVIGAASMPLLAVAPESDVLFKVGALLFFAYAALSGVFVASIEDKPTLRVVVLMTITGIAAGGVGTAIALLLGFAGLVVATALGLVAI